MISSSLDYDPNSDVAGIQPDYQVALPRGPPQRLRANYNDLATTVYVGHICNRVSDESVRELLDICGQVNKWTRQPDPVTGKWAHFGFCEYNRLEGAWRAIELLDGRQLGSKTLVVKADAKVQERISEFGNSHRVIPQNEEKLRSTISAMLTTFNSKWREVAMATDAERQPEKPVVAKTYERPATLETVRDDALPRWYKDSRREMDRLSRINRRRKDRQADFERALYDWENHGLKRILRDIEREGEDEAKLDDRKRRLIEEDGSGHKVRSDFSHSDRRREIESDERDRAMEEKEIQQKRDRDEADLAELRLKVSAFPADQPDGFKGSSSTPGEEAVMPTSVDPKVTVAVRRIPKTASDIGKIEIVWGRILTEQTVMKLRSWLKRKIRRTVPATDEEVHTFASCIVKFIELINPSLDQLVAEVSNFSRVSKQQAEEIGLKCFQLLIFTQIVMDSTR